MLTFTMGSYNVFSNNFADNCGGGMYVNVAGCSNPCDVGQNDKSNRYSANSAGISQGKFKKNLQDILDG